MYRLIEKLHLERYLNSRLILAIDLVVSGVASLCALVLVRLLLPPLSNISKFALLWIGCAVVYSFIAFFLLKTYRSVIRHSTLREIAKFVVAVIGKELLLGLTILLYPPTPLFGMHMLALLLFDLLLTLCGLILIRVAMIIVYDLVKNNLKSRKQHQLVLVYGLSEKSVSLVTRLQSSPHYKVVGFLTFGRRMKNHTITVFSRKLARISSSEILISGRPSRSSILISRIDCRMILPSMTSSIGGAIRIFRLLSTQ